MWLALCGEGRSELPKARLPQVSGRQLGHPFLVLIMIPSHWRSAPLPCPWRLRSAPSRVLYRVKRATCLPLFSSSMTRMIRTIVTCWRQERVCYPLTSRRGHPCRHLLLVSISTCVTLSAPRTTTLTNLHVQGGIVRLVSASRKRHGVFLAVPCSIVSLLAVVQHKELK
jgi:hypothetical protein